MLPKKSSKTVEHHVDGAWQEDNSLILSNVPLPPALLVDIRKTRIGNLNVFNSGALEEHFHMEDHVKYLFSRKEWPGGEKRQ